MAGTTAVIFLQLALVLVIAVETGFCLSCYECGISSAENCADYLPKSKECGEKSIFKNVMETIGVSSGGQPACLKYVAINPITGEDIVFRTCVTISGMCGNSFLSKAYKPLGFEKSCDICFEDNCNSSSIPSVELFILVPLILCGIFFS